MISLKTLSVLSCVLFLSSGCISAGDESPEAKTIHAEITSLQFSPTTIHAAVGDTIVWRNGDLVPHTIDEVDSVWKSGLVDPGQSYQLVVSKEGHFRFTCEYHPVMTGQLIVNE